MRKSDQEANRQVEDALADLVHQVAIGRYRDPLGHLLSHNAAFLRARALVDLQNVLEQRI